jgi:selenocysteine lyase/cysteine desulfurase
MLAIPRPTAADDHASWQQIADLYPTSADFVQLENGYVGMQSKLVLEACQLQQQRVNSQTSAYLRQQFPAELAQVKQQLAALCGVKPEELLLTRNLGEAMFILLQAYPFVAGDGVICSAQDYDAVLGSLQLLAQQKQLLLQQIALPQQELTEQQLLQCYEAAITSQTKVIVLSHLCHRHGHILPVAKISAMARRYGIDVIVDAAHSFAMLDFQLPDLGADFVAMNLHKWLGAPLGLGLLYIRQPRINSMQPVFGLTDNTPQQIEKLAAPGTPAVPQILSIPTAIALHQAIGAQQKQQRLSYLSHYWMQQVADLPGVRLVTPQATGSYCAIAAFQLARLPAEAVVTALWQDFGILTVSRALYQQQIVRVTPYLFSQPAELDRLVDALRQLARRSQP